MFKVINDDAEQRLADLMVKAEGDHSAQIARLNMLPIPQDIAARSIDEMNMEIVGIEEGLRRRVGEVEGSAMDRLNHFAEIFDFPSVHHLLLKLEGIGGSPLPHTIRVAILNVIKQANAN
jgi:hypothetical protein